MHATMPAMHLPGLVYKSLPLIYVAAGSVHTDIRCQRPKRLQCWPAICCGRADSLLCTSAAGVAFNNLPRTAKQGGEALRRNGNCAATALSTILCAVSEIAMHNDWLSWY